MKSLVLRASVLAIAIVAGVPSVAGADNTVQVFGRVRLNASPAMVWIGVDSADSVNPVHPGNVFVSGPMARRLAQLDGQLVSVTGQGYVVRHDGQHRFSRPAVDVQGFATGDNHNFVSGTFGLQAVGDTMSATITTPDKEEVFFGWGKDPESVALGRALEGQSVTFWGEVKDDFHGATVPVLTRVASRFLVFGRLKKAGTGSVIVFDDGTSVPVTSRPASAAHSDIPRSIMVERDGSGLKVAWAARPVDVRPIDWVQVYRAQYPQLVVLRQPTSWLDLWVTIQIGKKPHRPDPNRTRKAPPPRNPSGAGRTPTTGRTPSTNPAPAPQPRKETARAPVSTGGLDPRAGGRGGLAPASRAGAPGSRVPGLDPGRPATPATRQPAQGPRGVRGPSVPTLRTGPSRTRQPFDPGVGSGTRGAPVGRRTVTIGSPGPPSRTPVTGRFTGGRSSSRK